MTAPATRQVKLHWHKMFCPECLSTDLEVAFTGTARLTPDGTDDVGDHEWDNESRCACRDCGFASEVLLFSHHFRGDEGATVEIEIVEDEETGEEEPAITFEIQVYAMGEDENGDFTLCSAHNPPLPLRYYDIALRREVNFESEDPLLEIEDLTSLEELNAELEKLAIRFPDIDVNEV